MFDLARAVHRCYDGTTIGITGSAGKTTTKDLFAHVLGCHAPTVANPASFNNEIGFPATVTGVRPDTRYLVLEMGARGKGHVQALCDVARPGISTVLGIGSAHVGKFGSREAIADAKAEIVRALPTTGTAVLNADDPLVAAMRREHTGRIITFGTGESPDVRATGIDTVDGRPTFTLHHQGRTAPVRLTLHGRHHVTNALAACRDRPRRRRALRHHRHHPVRRPDGHRRTHGRHHPSRRRHHHQRRLQRRPRVRPGRLGRTR
ncbi:Mur ligase family protein [Streptomyces sp. NPDC057242]|uniref:Mur ligase family protein n=1 Tax=unclassified Streptomyces TaxID=2593676 RepID=UPI00364551DA